MCSMPLHTRHSEPASRDRHITHHDVDHDASLHHALELARIQLRGCDVVRFYLADEILLQCLDFDAQQG